MCPDLSPETGAGTNHSDWKLRGLDYLIHPHRGKGVLACGYEVVTIRLYPIHDRLEVGEISNSLVCSPIHHEWWLHERVCPVYEEVGRIVLERHLEPSQVANQEVLARSCNLGPTSKVDPSIFLDDFIVGLGVETENSLRPMPANLHVFLIILSDRNIRVQDIGDTHSDIIALLYHILGV